MNIFALAIAAVIALCGALTGCAPAEEPLMPSVSPTQAVLTPDKEADTVEATAEPETSSDVPDASFEPGVPMPTANPLYTTATVIATIDSVDAAEGFIYLTDPTAAPAPDALHDDSPAGQYAARLTEDTIIYDAGTGTVISADSLNAGDEVSACISQVMTKSVPPQTELFALITNLPSNGMGVPHFVRPMDVEEMADGLRITNQNADMYITVPDGTPVTNLESGDPASISDIHIQTRMLVWYDAVAESYPARATADKVSLLQTRISQSSDGEGAVMIVGEDGSITEAQSVPGVTIAGSDTTAEATAPAATEGTYDDGTDEAKGEGEADLP